MNPNQSEQAVKRAEFYSLPPDARIDRETVAAVLYCTAANLERLAIQGGGPPYRRVGRRALYEKAAVLKWMTDQGAEVSSTAQIGGAA